MAKQDRTVAIRTILEVFNEQNNKEAFKRMLFDEAARDIKSFYQNFVLPTMPKDLKLEVEGMLGVADIRGLLGDAIVIDAVANEIEEEEVKELTPGINAPYYKTKPDRFPLEEV